MEKRVLIAVVLSFLVLYGYQAYFVKPVPVPPQRTPGRRRASRAGHAPRPPGLLPLPGRPPRQPRRPPRRPQALVAADAERDVVVESDDGPRRVHEPGRPLEELAAEALPGPRQARAGTGPGEHAAGTALPFDLKVDDEAVTARLRDALFQPSSGGVVDASGGPQTLTFEFKDSAGLAARKEFVFQPGSFVVRFSSHVQVGEQVLNPLILWGPGLRRRHPGQVEQLPPEARGHDLPRRQKVQRLDARDIASQPVHEGEFAAAGVDDHYFISMALPTKPVHVEYQPVVVPAAPGAGPEEHARLHGVRACGSATPPTA